MNIGIIGQGFVGSAIREGLKKHHQISTFDIDEKKCNQTHEWVCLNSDIIFMCLPTPMKKDGSCDIRILEKAIQDVHQACLDGGRQESRPVLVIKSTVTPGTTDTLNNKYTNRCDGHPDMHICFSPEFLTEANSFEDFKNQSRIIIGSESMEVSTIVAKMFKEVFTEIPIIQTKARYAEMTKYFINCFLATKVIFANQMYQICTNNNMRYDDIVSLALFDERIGGTHLAVPGPDGDFGFGGHCFPKDLAAMIEFGSKNNANPSLLREVQCFNDKVRKLRDWESMKGRAVSDD